MKVETQQEIILVLGIMGIGALYKDYFTLIDVIVAGLIGFLSQRTQTEKQEEEYNQIVEKYNQLKERLDEEV